MNRSVLLDELTGVRLPGRTLTVAASWVHPRRGVVTSPAHPLLAHAVRRFRPVVVRDMAAGGCPEGGEGVLTTLSYVDVSGSVRGLAIGAPTDDVEAVGFIRRELRAWRSLLRTRRLLVVPASMADAETRTGRTAAAYAPRATNGGAWERCGCPADARCPAVADAVAAVRRYRADGDHILLVGSPPAGPPPLSPPAGAAHGVTVVPTVDEALTVEVADPAALACVVAPGAAIPQAGTVLKALRARFGPLRTQHPDQWCYTMTDLHLAVTGTLRECDRLLIGTTDRSPAARLARSRAREAAVPVHTIARSADLRPEQVDASVLMLLDSTPDTRLGTAVAGLLAGLGPCATVHRTVRSRTRPAEARRLGTSSPDAA
ncbi:hypothetical protein [Streptomyces hesseae]|uniref:4-hydroxy-3-methylbut-2-enyl diphosphate reductase n=1 Tax=Streptomyces hesseae TaxID=3075519 RepID=A0ABU2SGT3_9ACTN|nr:hypothetical protein [Streptomyces sp. DSM 40473]MDT0447841.1 hypothetical protein [Streptomyces sp. DSM 40473]